MFLPFFKLLVFIDKHNSALYQRNKKIANKLEFFEEKAFFRVKVADICCLYFVLTAKGKLSMFFKQLNQ